MPGSRSPTYASSRAPCSTAIPAAAAPVRIGDSGAVALRTGDRVDVIAADPQGRNEAVVVAEDTPVASLPRASDTALASGGLVVLAVTCDTARTLAAASVSAYLSVVVTR